ncbi:hypothetical protein OS175_11600 [Marinicella sp. S1101]|uniref:hypothetical protein n=1 Tax=Marinicella marina TaxID=2996016 RepID=UPI00226092EB|nr:hypothetical protein [Marinicella marina]MCX7554529.1 hypothetical protein [Marinicella marina]MDJ1141087.1 hypothetical protein [Marinicella marina]
MTIANTEEIDNIDFLYILRDHGWSSCLIYVNGKIYGYDLTHIFENPLEKLLSHLTGILSGELEVSFKWHDEPGHSLVTIKRNTEQNHLINISITNSFQVNTKSDEEFSTLNIHVKNKVFMTCVLKQMEKIRDLMTEQDYKDNRAKFPHTTFKSFKLAFDNCFSKRS